MCKLKLLHRPPAIELAAACRYMLGYDIPKSQYIYDTVINAVT